MEKYWLRQGYSRETVEESRRKLDEHRKKFPFLDGPGMPKLAACCVEKIDDELLGHRRRLINHFTKVREWPSPLEDVIEDFLDFTIFSRMEKIFLVSHDLRTMQQVGWKETVREAIATCPFAHDLLYIITAKPMKEQLRKKYWGATVHTISRKTTMAKVIAGFDQRQREAAEAKQAQLEAVENAVRQKIEAAMA
ncbi:MAG TPA: hypothetical protein VGP13_00175 [Candidatus Paceibacterota bacterium]|jgi:hypothetical protein|nr:hypothetical protein [Candidatus Paceibacterota bacterium]